MKAAPLSADLMVKLALGIAAVGLVLYGIKQVKGIGGIFTGNNVITDNATDANGNPVTAYQGAGIIGTLGAATNAASGGVLASVGGWIGRTAYDLTHSDPMAEPLPMTAPQGHTAYWKS